MSTKKLHVTIYQDTEDCYPKEYSTYQDNSYTFSGF